MKQTDIDAAMAEFLAKQAPTACVPILTAKQAEEAAKAARVTARQQAQQEAEARAAEHNAENRRYDSEGVYYIGGKEVVTKYGF
jgi:hypothetical protein